MFTRNLGSTNVLMSKWWGFVKEFQVAWDVGIKKFIVESDSKIVKANIIRSRIEL